MHPLAAAIKQKEAWEVAPKQIKNTGFRRETRIFCANGYPFALLASFEIPAL